MAIFLESILSEHEGQMREECARMTRRAGACIASLRLVVENGVRKVKRLNFSAI
jgi:hypothetical protein